MSMILLLLFTAFGVVCGVYLSIVGFAVTTLVIFAVLGLINAIGDGVMTPLFLAVAFVCEQVGFFLAVAGSALRETYRRGRPAGQPVDGSVRVEPEQPH